MSLSANERQALDAIADGLVASAPRLAALLTTFTRQAADAEMPRHEKVGRCEARVTGRLRRLYRPPDLGRGLLLWLALAMVVTMVSGIGLAVSHSGGRTCTNSFALACTERAGPRPPRPASHRPSGDVRASSHGRTGAGRAGTTSAPN